MESALAEARAAGARGETPVGAVLVRAGEILAADGNRVRGLADPTAHAEMLVLRRGAALLGNERLEGCDLYVTLEPCPMCAGAMSLARIRRLYYGAGDPKSGGVAHGPRVFEQPTCHHAPEVISGLAEAEASALLRQFFQARRG
ncbi:MAG: nucleoside deaminase [Pseudomonadota bacterium]